MRIYVFSKMKLVVTILETTDESIALLRVSIVKSQQQQHKHRAPFLALLHSVSFWGECSS